MRKIIASILAVFFVLFSPISAYAAATTESMMMFSSDSGSDEYAVMPLAINTDGVDFYVSYALYNSQLLKNTFSPQYKFVKHFTDEELKVYFSSTNSMRPALSLNSSSYNYDYVVFSLEFYDFEDKFFGISSGDLELNIGNLFFAYIDESGYGELSPSDISYITYDFSRGTSTSSTRNLDYEEQKISNSSLSGSGQHISFNHKFDTEYSFDSSSVTSEFVNGIKINFYFNKSLFDGNITALQTGFTPSNTCFLSYDIIHNPNDGTQTEIDNQEEMMGGLNNINTSIQTGLSNVFNSVVQMANQAQQIGQQTVQAVTQMTQQLNTSIDQQRQDILNGLGLLGDDIGSTMDNVKAEITNIGSTITNKLESTTESITNKIESTTETITNTIETKVDQVTTAVEDVKESVTEVKQSILDLPNKIKDMLLGLIVPDSQTMANKYSEFSQLLEQKLGVIYQIPMMLFDFFDTIVNAATTPQSTLTLPAFRLPWIDGSQLTIWNSMEYKIIPDGLEVLSDLIRTVTSMTVVVLTFNSVKQAYERFLRS